MTNTKPDDALRERLEALAEDGLLVTWDKDYKFAFSQVVRLMAEFVIEVPKHLSELSRGQGPRCPKCADTDLSLDNYVVIVCGNGHESEFQEFGDLAQFFTPVDVDALSAAMECKARKAGTAGGNYPQDCDWPFCGCDPKADRVIEAIHESGLEIFDARELASLLTDVAQLLDGWHNDGTAWSEWDESVRKRVADVLRRALGVREE